MKRFSQSACRANGNTSVLGDERGLTTVEYIIILVVIAVMAIGVWKNFSKSVKAQVVDSQTAIDGLQKEEDSK